MVNIYKCLLNLTLGSANISNCYSRENKLTVQKEHSCKCTGMQSLKITLEEIEFLHSKEPLVQQLAVKINNFVQWFIFSCGSTGQLLLKYRRKTKIK